MNPKFDTKSDPDMPTKVGESPIQKVYILKMNFVFQIFFKKVVYVHHSMSMCGCIHTVTRTYLPSPEGYADYKQLPAAVASSSSLTLLPPSAHSRRPANSTKKYTPKRRPAPVLSGRARQPLLEFVFLNVGLSSQRKILL